MGKDDPITHHQSAVDYYQEIIKLPEGLGDFSTFLKHFKDYQNSDDFKNQNCSRTLKITLKACLTANKIEKCQEIYRENKDECDKRIKLIEECRERMSSIEESPLEMTFQKISDHALTCQKLLNNGKLLQKRFGEILVDWHTKLLNYGNNEKSGTELSFFIKSCLSFKGDFEILKKQNTTHAEIIEAIDEFFKNLTTIEMEFKKNDKITINVSETKNLFEKIHKCLNNQRKSCITCKDGVECDLFKNMCSNHYYDAVLVPKIFNLKNQIDRIFWDDVDNEDLEKHLDNINKISNEEITEHVLLISTETLKSLENSVNYLEKVVPSLKKTSSNNNALPPSSPSPSSSSSSSSSSSRSSSCISTHSEEDVEIKEKVKVKNTKKRLRDDDDDNGGDDNDDKKLRDALEVLIQKKPKNVLSLLQALKDKNFLLFEKMISNDDTTTKTTKCFIIIGCFKEDGLSEILSSHPTWEDAKKNLPKETEYLKYKIHKILN
jgi:hypothetical protein